MRRGRRTRSFGPRARRGSRPRRRRARGELRAASAGSSIWYGVANTVAASSETPVRRRGGRGSCPAPGDDHGLGLLAARSAASSIRARPEARPRAPGRRAASKKSANSRPTRCSIERIRARRLGRTGAVSGRPPGRRSRRPARRSRRAMGSRGTGARTRRQQALLDAARRDLREVVAGGVVGDLARLGGEQAVGDRDGLDARAGQPWSDQSEAWRSRGSSPGCAPRACRRSR